MSDNCCGIKVISCCSGSCCTDNAENKIETVSTKLTFKDRLGTWKVRFGIGRMDYKIDPGLYAVGNPDDTSPVLVSANYKLTFDMLRKELTDIDCWILILDTKGINVWCAAGKGTFGTDELIYRLEKTGLAKNVSHRKLILPQLGAPGVSAHEVSRKTGFSVVYGPVRARDIKAFLDAGMKATTEMRTVRFTTWDRLVLTPVELVAGAKISLTVFGVLFLINLFAARPFGVLDFIAYAGSVLVGTVLTPLLLPIIPGRAFAWKGWLLGLLWTVCILWQNGWLGPEYWMLASGYLLALPAFSGFLAMNFTGSSTYTSFSGVMREMKIAVPMIATSIAAGSVLILIKTLVG